LFRRRRKLEKKPGVPFNKKGRGGRLTHYERIRKGLTKKGEGSRKKLKRKPLRKENAGTCLLRGRSLHLHHEIVGGRSRTRTGPSRIHNIEERKSKRMAGGVKKKRNLTRKYRPGRGGFGGISRQGNLSKNWRCKRGGRKGRTD